MRKHLFYRMLTITVISFICLFSAGCFQGEFGMTITEDGKVSLNNEIIGIPLLHEQIEDLKNQMVKNVPTSKITSISKDNMTGYRMEVEYPSIEEFAANAISMYGTHPGKCKGIQKHSGWFFDEYNFDFFMEGKNSGEDASDQMAQAMLSQVKFDLIFNLPYAAESNNADTRTNENKTLTWHLASSLTSGVDKSIQARFRMWHKERIAITAIVAVLLLGATILFFVKSNNETDEAEKEEQLQRAKICGGLTAAVIVASAYMLYAPIEFTDGDIISATHNKNNSSSNESQAVTNVNPNANSTSTPKNSTDTTQKSTSAAPTGEHWIKDTNSGAYLWNPEPSGNETVSWSGNYVQDGDYRYADGSGTLKWYRDGKLIQTDEGTFERGRHNGQFKHTFPSGKVSYSNWNHGKEVAEQNSDEDQAKQTFINYHKAITNENYREAYDTLSNAQKERVGDFNSYAAGYADTISSEISNINLVSSDGDSYTFDYTLVARDRYQGSRVKIQTFDGQVTMAKDNGRWYIRSARSTKTGERIE